MDSSIVFKKTAKGQEAFASRSPELNPKQRSVLIMVDGKRTVGELSRLAAACGDVAALIGDLDSAGMVEVVGGAVAKAAAPATTPPVNAFAATLPAAPAQPSAPAVPRSLKDAQRFAVRSLNDALGPAAESIAIRIEASKNASEVLALAQRAAEMLAGARGKAAAQAMLDGVKLRLPE